jgi:thioesterase domain-containing protein
MQPPGPVIVLAHSMGGLLAADAATDPSNNEDHRIIGMVAFDTPYLGLHPHVVVSGIASLFRDDEDNKAKPTVKDMNEEQHVHMVDDAVTADWAAYKKGMPST